MKKLIEFKRCPFCNKPTIFYKNRENYFIIKCSNKNCLVKPKGKSKDFSLLYKTWNGELKCQSKKDGKQNSKNVQSDGNEIQ